MTLGIFSTTTPADTDLEGDGASNIRTLAARVKERVELDHNFSGLVDPESPSCDGYHNKVTLKRLTSAPTALSASIGTATFAESDTSIGTCTISNAAPCVITKSSHGLVTGDKVYMTTTGSLPTGLTADTIYYVIYINSSSFYLSECYENAVIDAAHPNKTALGACTISNASPAIVGKNEHGMTTGERVYFTTTGALPTGLNASVGYYVILVSDSTFKLASSYANAIAGTAINTSDAGSGVHTCYYYNRLGTSSAGSGTHTLLKDNGVIVTRATHGLATGDRIKFTTTSSLPSGLLTTADYYAVYIDASTFRLASSRSYAVAGKTLPITSAGSGTHTCYKYQGGYGFTYTKAVDDITELFFMDAETGTEFQLTNNGVLGLCILNNNIDCNDKTLSDGYFQGAFRSEDGTEGYTGTISFTEYLGISNYYGYSSFSDGKTYYYLRYAHAYRTSTITVKNGLVTAYSVGSTSYLTAHYWDVLDHIS